MASQDLHDVIFEWPHTEPTAVIVTGTFDKWSCSVPMTKTSTGFTGSTKIPWGEKIKFKYVVDGEWLLHENQATETDPGGFVNHTYTAPPAPQGSETRSPALTAVPTAESLEDKAPVREAPTENGDHTATETVEPAAEVATEAPADEAVEVKKVSDSEPKAVANASSGLPQLLSDIADTIAARDGTSSAFDYVASGLGVAMHNMVGMDPINNQPISIPTPVTDVAFAVPGGQESAPNSAVPPAESAPGTAEEDLPESLPSPMTSIVPMMIVPVNAAENNTVASSPPPETETTEASSIPETAAAPSVLPLTETGESSTPVAPSADEVPTAEVSIPAAKIAVVNTEENGSAIEHADVEEKTSSASDSQSIASVIVEPVTIQASIPESAPPTVTDSSESAVAEPDTATTSLSAEIKDDVLSTFMAEPIVAHEPVAKVKVEEVDTPIPAATEENVAEAEKVEPEAPAIIVDVVPQSETTNAPLVDHEAEAPAVIEPPSGVEKASLPNDEPNVAAPTVEQTPAEQVVDVDEVAVKESVPSVAESIVAEAPTKEDSPVAEPPITEVVPLKEEEVPVNEEKVIIPAPIIEEVPAKEEEVVVPVPIATESPVKEEIVSASVTEEPVKEEAAASAPIVEELPKKEEQTAESNTEEEPSTHVISVSELSTLVTDKSAVESNAEEPTVATEAAAPEASSSKEIPAEVSVVSSGAPTAAESASEPEAPVGSVVSEPTVASPKQVAESTSETTTETPVVDKVTQEPATSSANGLEIEAKSDKPVGSNGHSESASATEASPSKSKDEKAFPSSESPVSSADNTPSSSKVNTMRKKRTSILGKLKNIFHTDKDKDRK